MWKMSKYIMRFIYEKGGYILDEDEELKRKKLLREKLERLKRLKS